MTTTGAHGIVAVGAVERVDQLVHHVGVDRVELLGTIEGEGKDALVVELVA